MIGRFLHSLRRDEEGAALIELTLATPMLLVLVMGITDASNAFSRKLEIEQGAQRAIEKVMQTTEFKTVHGTIKSEVAAQANVEESQVTVEFPRYCNGRRMPDTTIDDEGFSDGEPCGPSERESWYILVNVTENYEPLFPVFSLGTKQADGTYKVEAKAGMRTQ